MVMNKAEDQIAVMNIRTAFMEQLRTPLIHIRKGDAVHTRWVGEGVKKLDIDMSFQAFPYNAQQT